MWVTPYLPCSRGCEACGIIVNYLSNPQCSNYSFEDKFLLMHKTDPDVLATIANKMVQAISPDEVKKN